MRNFKKFLALVLAMLMVSACAISVSAFADDEAVAASKFTDAIKKIAGDKFQILVGDENGVVDPNRLVRRDEAAVMFAKLNAGAKGKIMEWDSAKTTYYDDVDAEWSFSYINYVTDKELMQGIGEGKFAPTENITLAEVLTIAVNAIEDAFNDYLNFEDQYEAPKWYSNYMRAARNNGLTTKLGTADYEAYATKAQVAQIVNNMMLADPAIEANFEVTTLKGVVTFNASTVTVTESSEKAMTFTVDAFKEEAAKFGISADYKALAADGTKLYVEYTRDANNVPTIFKMAVAVSYDDVKVEKAPKENDAEVAKILINDVLYTTDKDNTGAETSFVGGAAGLPVVTVSIYESGSATPTTFTNAKDTPLPAFFKAVAADTDANGVIDAVSVYAYEYGTIEKAATQIAKDNTYAKAAAIDNVIIKNYSGAKALDNTDDSFKKNELARTVVFAAASNKDFAYSAEKPVLYRYDIDKNTEEIVIDVWKIAEVVEGKLISYSTSNKNITIEDKGAFAYLLGADTKAPGEAALNQNISFYAIDGKFAKLTGTALTETAILVDNVVVKDGKAVISGLDAKNGYKAIKDFVVEGFTAKVGEKLTKQGAFAFKDTEVAADGNKYAGKIMLAEKADTAEDKATLVFEDGKVYNFVVTSDGLNYVVKGSAEDLKDYAYNAAGAEAPLAATYTGTATDTVKVDGSYIYQNDVAKSEVKDIAIITVTNPDNPATDGYKNFYGNKAYTSASTFAKKVNVTAWVVTKDSKAIVMIVDEASDMGTEIKTFEEGAQLVQVISKAIDVAYDYSTYSAVDLISGKKVTVKGNGLTPGVFYVVKDGTVAFQASGEGSATNQPWVVKKTIKVEFNGGIVGTIKATPTVLEKAATEGAKWKAKTEGVDEKAYGIDKIVIYATADKEIDGESFTLIALNDADTAAKTIEIGKSNLKTSHLNDTETDRTLTNVLSYIVDGTMIVIGNPA